MKRIFTTLLFCAMTAFAFAQGAITGTIMDAETGFPLVATVSVTNGEGRTVDLDGEHDHVFYLDKKRWYVEGEFSISTDEDSLFIEIRKGLELIQELDPAIASFIERQWGRMAFKDGYQRALEFYEKSIESNPNDARMHNSLGMLYWQNGEVKKAIAEFVKALRINPCSPDAVVNLGDVLMRIKEDDKAQRLYAAYLSTNPQDKDLLKAVANIGC